MEGLHPLFESISGKGYFLIHQTLVRRDGRNCPPQELVCAFLNTEVASSLAFFLAFPAAFDFCIAAIPWGWSGT